MMQQLLKTLLMAFIVMGVGLTPADAVSSRDWNDFGTNATDANFGTRVQNLTAPAESLVDNTARQGRFVVYGVGGLGAIALGTLAFFGRFQWGWFFGLIGGLVLIAAANVGIEAITGADNVLGNDGDVRR